MTSYNPNESRVQGKIGFFVSLIYFKDDVRRLIIDLSHHYDIVLFVLDVHEASEFQVPKDIEVRTIRQNPSMKDRLLKSMFSIFGKIPKSQKNYHLMEAFKAQAQRKNHIRTRIILWLKSVLPKILSYDLFLDLLDDSSVCDLEDICATVFFTNICSDWALKQVLAQRINTICYVYSWDHATKHQKFSKRVKYAVWSDEIGNDLCELQGIERSHIATLGASQFCFIATYFHIKNLGNLPETKLITDAPYVYFGCAVGISSLVDEEVMIIKIIAEVLLEIAPSYKLLVRPYPVLAEWSPYNELKEIPNILLESEFRTIDLAPYNDSFFSKYHTLDNAKAFFHCGTTLGLEAVFFETPSFLVDLSVPSDKDVSMYNFVNQYQNVKYLKEINSDNVISSTEKLKDIILDLVNNQEAYLSYNRDLRKVFQIENFDEIKNRLIRRLLL